MTARANPNQSFLPGNPSRDPGWDPAVIYGISSCKGGLRHQPGMKSACKYKLKSQPGLRFSLHDAITSQQIAKQHPSVTHPVVPQNFLGNKVKPLQSAPILHQEDLKKCPGLLNCLNKFVKPQISLETFCMCPSGSSRGIFQLCFMMRKVGVREAPPPPAGPEH